MYTSVALLALAGFFDAAAAQPGVSWLTDYSQAMKRGKEEGKALAVFLGSGQTGYQQLVKEGQLGDAAAKVLKASYLPVYLDVSTPAGQKVAKDLGITQGKGLVISDHSCQIQAFWHDGSLAQQDLVQSLKRFSDPSVPVRGTLTAATADSANRTSYYQAPATYGGRGC